jgi:hypothetical protein
MKPIQEKIFPYTNLLLVIISNILVFWTWFKIGTAKSDTMFMGLLIIPLLVFTIYYLGLLLWAFRLLKTPKDQNDKRQVKNLILLLINVIPMVLIYKLTT